MFQEEPLDPRDFESSADYDERMTRLNEYMGLPEDTRISIGIALEDMIKDCTYLGTSCNNAR